MPRSRTNPQYNKDTLPETLAEYQVGYTHIAERWWRRRHCDDQRADNPISNGVFIAAAIALGFPIRRIHDNYSVQIGISSRSLRNIDR